MPIKVIITAGTTADCKKAIELIDEFDADAIFADKAYDTDKIIDAIYSKRAQAVIPSKSNRKEPRVFDEFLYRYRHLVENAFEKLKGWRGIATRYAKRSDSFLAAVQIRCLFLWLKIL